MQLIYELFSKMTLLLSFHDYNSIKDSIEILKGIYVLNNDQLTLRYTDRPQQKFIYHFGRYEDERYIRKGKYYFVKQ